MLNGKFLKLEPNPSKPQKSYIVQDTVGRNILLLAASLPGEGKSLFFQILLYHIVYGAPFLGKDVPVGNVMLIDSENELTTLQNRFKKMKKGLEMDGYKMQGLFDIQHYSGLFLDDELEGKPSWQPITTAIQQIRPSVIMLDHLLCFHQQDENKSQPMKQVGRRLKELRNICNSTAFVMHHFNKSEGSFIRRLRGSTAIYADTDAAYEVRTLGKDNGRLSKVGLIPQPRKEITPISFRVKLAEGPDWMKLVYDGTYEPMEDAKLDALSHDIFHYFIRDKNEKTVLDVNELLAGDAEIRDIRASLHNLEDRKFLESSRKGSKGGKLRYWLLPGLLVCPWCGITI